VPREEGRGGGCCGSFTAAATVGPRRARGAPQELLERAKARKAAREAAKAAGLSLEDYEERLRAELARGEAEATTKAARK